MERGDNLLGALALAVADRQGAAVAEVAGDESAAAALSSLLHFLEAPSLDLLRQVLGLTASGAVRVVDRLEHRGLVVRGAGPDRRTRSVGLTPLGRRTARKVVTARAAVLTGVQEGLSPGERAQLDLLVGKVLAGMIRAPGATRWTCRLCDTVACGRSEGHCPVANAAEARYGGVLHTEIQVPDDGTKA